MKTMQLREAKAKLSALVEAAERGETTIVTKNGRPAAVVAPVSENHREEGKPSFAELLMSIPHSIPIRRSRSRARSVKF